MAKLDYEDIVTMKKLASMGESNCEIARKFKVTEGTVRYHKRRNGTPDGRKKDFLIAKLDLEGPARAWWKLKTEEPPKDRPPSIQQLFDWLTEEHNYTGSYVAVRRFARDAFGMPKKRALRRVETPPGAQSQTDWAERTVDIGDPDGPTELHAFIMILSHSRRPVVVWSRDQKQLSWHHCHNESFRRLGGVPAVNRIDNLKTGIAKGSGPWSTINSSYHAYARQMRFHVDACEGYSPEQKGKVEAAVKILDRMGLAKKRFDGIEGLQAWTDVQLDRDARKRICPPTGRSIHLSWRDEIPFLQSLPETMPAPFDVIKNCRVHQGCLIHFEMRKYGVPFSFLDQKVEVRGVPGEVHVHDPETGMLLVRYPRGTRERILLNHDCHDGHTSDTIEAPKPFGKMARKLLEINSTPVQERPVDLYEALLEVAQ